ncbi:hypothetical protein ONS95_000738 [Cadophora gregata]|uniref:uncharacterized protein n=1 Tax=Cadophora gregata TaxID=51156 RepID=UPI0026DAFF76|nr:uncharacterized protein ONS95_000738 [Cadophora gregata]KAK0103083.1 hypothetical protein ONS96_005694 [Cadophora gregata f. sp. sojae]KAK0128788.1 hypothetical protein ONS95_000738 [Cadophora gregata]
MTRSSLKLTTFIISSILFSLVSASPRLLSSDCGWTYVGCVLYQSSGRPLTTRFAPSTTVDTTIENCQAVCSENDFAYAGMEDGWGCYCGDDFDTPLSHDGYCNEPCFGDRSELCGGHLSQSIYVDTCAVEDSILSSSSSTLIFEPPPTSAVPSSTVPSLSFTLGPPVPTPPVPTLPGYPTSPPSSPTPSLSSPIDTPSLSLSLGPPSAIISPSPETTPSLSLSPGPPSTSSPASSVTEPIVSLSIGTPTESGPLSPPLPTLSLPIAIPSTSEIPRLVTTSPFLPGTSYSKPNHPNPSDSTQYTTSTMTTTKTYTISSCPSSVKSCPYGSTTTTVSHITTKCPIPPTPAAPTLPTISTTPQTTTKTSTTTITSNLTTTLLIQETHTYPITSCAPTVTQSTVGYTTVVTSSSLLISTYPVPIPVPGASLSTDSGITTTTTITTLSTSTETVHLSLGSSSSSSLPLFTLKPELPETASETPKDQTVSAPTILPPKSELVGDVTATSKGGQAPAPAPTLTSGPAGQVETTLAPGSSIVVVSVSSVPTPTTTPSPIEVPNGARKLGVELFVWGAVVAVGLFVVM